MTRWRRPAGPEAAVRRSVRVGRARWLVGFGLAGAFLVLAPIATWANHRYEDDLIQDGRRADVTVTRIEEDLAFPAKTSRRTAFAVVDGRERPLERGAALPVGARVAVVYDSDTVLPLAMVESDAESRVGGVIFGLVLAAACLLIPLGPGASYRALRSVAPRTDRSLPVTIRGLRKVPHPRGPFVGALRNPGISRAIVEVDVVSADGALRWCGQMPMFGGAIDTREAPDVEDAATLVGGKRAGEWAYLAVTKRGGGRLRACPPASPLT